MKVVTTLCLMGIVGGGSPLLAQGTRNVSSRAAELRQGGRSSLAVLFGEWQAFEQPRMRAGVPDYSAAAMARQYRALASYRRRLAAIDTSGWSIHDQVDYQIVRAEMNGLDFNHRVLRPWARDPAFYVSFYPSRSDQPAREGPVNAAAIELWTYSFPLTPANATELAARLRAISPLLASARANLTGNARDLWVSGGASIRQQSTDLASLSARVARIDPAVDSAAREARSATDEFARWLDARASSKTGTSGIGIDNYNWYLKNVQLVPYDWAQEELLMRRELDRSRASLRLAEDRNASVPPQQRIGSAEAYNARFNAAVTEYVTFMREHHIMSMRDYMDPALRDRAGAFVPSPHPLEFFDEVNHRDPIVMLTHDYHWIDLARMEHEPNPDVIRRGGLPYNIFVTRTEGFATAMEEMMMQEGFLDGHPRSNELIYVLVAERAARALGDLRLHSNAYTLDQAKRFATSQTPRGWLRMTGTTVGGEQHLYLQQPAYGTSYVIGKVQFDKLVSDRAHQLGDAYSTERLMDQFNAAGLIPMSLIRWEITGNPDEIIAMSKP